MAEEALALGVELIVPLPMPREAYIKDFQTEESVREFDRLCEAANEILRLPLARGNTLETIADYGTVSYFSVQTFATGIYTSWFTMADRAAAAQLALCLLGFALLLAILERIQRGAACFE